MVVGPAEQCFDNCILCLCDNNEKNHLKLNKCKQDWKRALLIWRNKSAELLILDTLRRSFSDLNALMQQCHCKTIHFIWKRHFHFHFVDFYIWKICPMDNCPDKYKQKYVYCLRNRRKILQNLSTMYVTKRPEEYLRLKMWLFS